MKSDSLKQILSKVLNQDLEYFNSLNNSKWLIIGGSGFVGKWIINLLCYVSETLNIKIDVIVTSRNPTLAMKKILDFRYSDSEEIYSKRLSVFRWNSFDIESMPLESVTHIVHAGTPTTIINEEVLEVVDLTESLLERISRIHTLPFFLHLSSGAVYKGSARLQRKLSEIDDVASEDDSLNLYQLCKVKLENRVNVANDLNEIKGVNARLFTFLGPGFPLNAHFAISQFVVDCLQNRPISIKGHPDTQRTYMDPVDLLMQIFRILKVRESEVLGPINVGGEDAWTMFELASKVNLVFSGVGVKVEHHTSAFPSFYIPDIRYASSKLGATTHADLDYSLRNWYNYLKH